MATLIVLALFHLFLIQTNRVVSSEYNGFANWENQQNALFVMDSLVKNHNTEHPYLGSAAFDSQKHRVRSNELDSKLLLHLSAEHGDNIVRFVKLELRFFDGENQMLVSEENTDQKNCVGIERVVLVSKRKALLFGVICRD